MYTQQKENMSYTSEANYTLQRALVFTYVHRFFLCNRLSIVGMSTEVLGGAISRSSRARVLCRVGRAYGSTIQWLWFHRAMRAEKNTPKCVRKKRIWVCSDARFEPCWTDEDSCGAVISVCFVAFFSLHCISFPLLFARIVSPIWMIWHLNDLTFDWLAVVKLRWLIVELAHTIILPPATPLYKRRHPIYTIDILSADLFNMEWLRLVRSFKL